MKLVRISWLNFIVSLLIAIHSDVVTTLKSDRFLTSSMLRLWLYCTRFKNIT